MDFESQIGITPLVFESSPFRIFRSFTSAELYYCSKEIYSDGMSFNNNSRMITKQHQNNPLNCKRAFTTGCDHGSNPENWATTLLLRWPTNFAYFLASLTLLRWLAVPEKPTYQPVWEIERVGKLKKKGKNRNRWRLGIILCPLPVPVLPIFLSRAGRWK